MPKEYIEREAFIKILKETKDDCKHYPNKVVCDFAIKMVNLMPPADVQEVIHGKWYYGICTCCGWEMPDRYSYDGYDDEPLGKMSYCPNCGAKMDKE